MAFVILASIWIELGESSQPPHPMFVFTVESHHWILVMSYIGSFVRVLDVFQEQSGWHAVLQVSVLLHIIC
jgi:hypothetical protein